MAVYGSIARSQRVSGNCVRVGGNFNVGSQMDNAALTVGYTTSDGTVGNTTVTTSSNTLGYWPYQSPYWSQWWPDVRYVYTDRPSRAMDIAVMLKEKKLVKATTIDDFIALVKAINKVL